MEKYYGTEVKIPTHKVPLITISDDEIAYSPSFYIVFISTIIVFSIGL